MFVRFSMSATPAAVLRVETRNKVHPDLSTPTAVVKYVIVSIRGAHSQSVSLDVSYTQKGIRIRDEIASSPAFAKIATVGELAVAWAEPSLESRPDTM